MAKYLQLYIATRLYMTVMYKLCPCVSQSHCQCQSVFEVVDHSVSRLLRWFTIFPASRRYRSPSNLS